MDAVRSPAGPRPLAEGLVTGDEPPRLVASRCGTCRAISFPARQACPSCPDGAVTRELVGPRGTLWTWTVQTFPPKPPFLAAEPFEPFGVGYVQFPGQLRVEGRLTEGDPARLRIGMPMEVTVLPIPGHEQLTTYAFAPVAE